MRLRGGYAGTVLRVDLTSGAVRREPLEEGLALAYVGGRGFTSRLQYDLIPPDVEPLGPENVVIVAPGPLTGTPAPSSSRFTLGGRSPLTGILGDANGGGFWAAVLKRAGYDLILLHGRSPRPVYLSIDDDRVELRDGSHIWGKDTRQTQRLIREELGKNASVAAIGQAGERLVRFAGFVADGEHLAARTGLGAVLGSKRLKAIAVRGSRQVPLYDPAAFTELVGQLIELLRSDSRSGAELPQYGTTALLDHHTAIGGVNTRNFQSGLFEGKESVDGDALNRRYLVRPTACYRCPCRCDRFSRVDEGEFAGTEVGGPEYSTLVAFGPACGNDNLASILKANELCNLYGLDALETGNMIAFSMELFQRGILSRAETDGIDLTWGNYRSILEMIERIALRRGFGNLLAEGIRRAALEIGRNSERYAVHVKGMTPPPLDPRAVKVYNFRYAVSPRGADHLRISAPGAYGLDSLPRAEAAARLLRWENIVTIPDLMGVCKFPYSYYAETVELTLRKMLEVVPALYSAATGLRVSGDDLLRAAERVNNVERAHNARLGLTSAEDTLPPRFTEDPMPEGPAKGRVYDILDDMKQAWYAAHGWDTQTGRPTRGKLEELGLADIALDLEERGLGRSSTDLNPTASPGMGIKESELRGSRTMTRLIDLSMEVSGDMVVFPRVAPPIMAMLESWEDFANSIGAARYGATWLTAHYVVVLGDHVGTHVDSLRHLRSDAPGPEGIPLECCYADGVVLDFSDRPVGYGITADDLKRALDRIEYTLKPLDIVLIKTGASRYNTETRYLTEHCGMTRESTNWLIDQGIKMMGIDAPTWDRPVKSMFETREFWPAHLVMTEREYYHLENLANLDAIPAPTGFKVAVFPIRWKGTTAAPVRAVAIVEG